MAMPGAAQAGLAVTQLPGAPARLLRPLAPFKPRRAQPSPAEPNRAEHGAQGAARPAGSPGR